MKVAIARGSAGLSLHNANSLCFYRKNATIPGGLDVLRSFRVFFTLPFAAPKPVTKLGASGFSYQVVDGALTHGGNPWT
ncbi:MAG: hypothetical protein ACTJLK_03375 [Anaplasma sp.]